MSDRLRITGVALGLCLCASISFAAETSEPPAEAPLQVTISGFSYSSTVHDTQAKLRKTQAAENPEVSKYMDLVDAGLADSTDLETFGNFLAERGFLELAAVYSREALRFDPENAHYWTNYGTIQRQMGDNPSAIDAYKKAIAIDPGMAIAQYNLGVAYDAKGKYDKALEQYVIAFTIDPTLADASVNPQVVNNFLLPAASLLLYKRRAGNQALPLIDVNEMNPAQLQVNIPISE
jgi:tetratricopeptide (TPR) repeat protein